MALADEVERKGLRLEKLEKYRSTNMGYEVFAPDHHRFTDGPHSRVCYDAAEVRDFIKQHKASDVEPCESDCDCMEVEA